MNVAEVDFAAEHHASERGRERIQDREQAKKILAHRAMHGGPGPEPERRERRQLQNCQDGAGEDDEAVAVAQELVVVRRPFHQVERQTERNEHEKHSREPRYGRGGGNDLYAVQVEHADHEINRLPVVRLQSAILREHHAVDRNHEYVPQKEHADQTPHRDETNDEVRERELRAADKKRAEVRRYQHHQA